ncbi:MAG TPA: protein-L-isoaspartate(D-aspartate) O-methyltransferase [Spirochaetia bacterium]|nr:protein-L-isoaspartate(D-aspartate) O-methyltransferase [Spirochaetia bacterium]
MDSFADLRVASQQRKIMVETQIVARGVRDARVIEAFLAVPRHLFVPTRDRYRAYQDSALPIGYGQTISQPYIVALMLEIAGLRGVENVLEIGTGSGYTAALLSSLTRSVTSIERIDPLARRARGLCGDLGVRNVSFFSGDGSSGKPDAAPFDAIIVWAAAIETPPQLFEQLADNGVLLGPEGERTTAQPTDRRSYQMLVQYRKRGRAIVRTEICAVSFVPLVTGPPN